MPLRYGRARFVSGKQYLLSFHLLVISIRDYGSETDSAHQFASIGPLALIVVVLQMEAEEPEVQSSDARIASREAPHSIATFAIPLLPLGQSPRHHCFGRGYLNSCHSVPGCFRKLDNCLARSYSTDPSPPPPDLTILASTALANSTPARSPAGD